MNLLVKLLSAIEISINLSFSPPGKRKEILRQNNFLCQGLVLNGSDFFTFFKRFTKAAK